MVINDAKVVPSRLIGTKATGGRIEALILRHIGEGRYEALVKGKTAPGTEIIFTRELQAAVEEDLGGGKKVIKFSRPERGRGHQESGFDASPAIYRPLRQGRGARQGALPDGLCGQARRSRRADRGTPFYGSPHARR